MSAVCRLSHHFIHDSNSFFFYIIILLLKTLHYCKERGPSNNPRNICNGFLERKRNCDIKPNMKIFLIDIFLLNSMKSEYCLLWFMYNEDLRASVKTTMTENRREVSRENFSIWEKIGLYYWSSALQWVDTMYIYIHFYNCI